MVSASLLASLQLTEMGGTCWTRRTRIRTSAHSSARAGQRDRIYTIFEGTSEIQRLVIARAISGMHIQ